MSEGELPDSVTALRELVSIPSISENETEAVDHLIGIMTRLGFDAHRDEAGNAVGNTKGKGKHVMLVGHIDTVEGLIPVKESDGILTGRGTVDAKGPLMAMVFAASRFIGSNDINITVIGAVEEEGSSKGARALKDRYKPDFVVVGEPSGWEGICIGYKGHMRATYRVQCPHVHRAHPQANAIEVALQYYAEVQNLCGNRDYFNKEPLFESLTCAPQDIRIERDEKNTMVEIDLDFRIPLDYDMEELENTLTSFNIDGELNIYHTDPPILVDKNNALVRSFLSAIRANKGDPKFKKKTGTSDMNVLAQYWSVPMVSYGPGDSSLDHTGEEHIRLDEYRRSIEVLANALESLSSVD